MLDNSCLERGLVLGIVPFGGPWGTVPEQPCHFPSATIKDENGGASAGKVARNKMVP